MDQATSNRSLSQCWRAFATATTLALSVGGCALPEHMEVRAGVDPRNQDDDVRFRTTYYFRVFDFCQANEPKDRRVILDSLYRFRMTGKANALFSKVHFESGSLHKSEIDPFGANIEFDDQSGRAVFVSRQRTEERALQNERRKIQATQLEEIDELIDRRHRLQRQLEGLSPAGLSADDKTKRQDELRKNMESLDNRITSMIGELAKPETETITNTSVWLQELRSLNEQFRAIIQEFENISKDADDKTKAEVESLRESILELMRSQIRSQINRSGADSSVLNLTPEGCPQGARLQRGFQILGPEGMRTFDQDERLLLAMSSSGKPLISALKEISGRVLSEQPSREAQLLPLVQENLRVVRAARSLDGFEGDTAKSADDVVRAIIAEFDAVAGATIDQEDDDDDD